MPQDKKPKILCVDDEKLNLKLLKSILEPEGYEFEGAQSGEAALVQAAEGCPDLVLLDIMMPKMTGFEVLQKLRADKLTQLTPVVMITALRETEDRVKALEAGCDDFISKPFDKVELLARVKSILKASYYRRQLDEKEKFHAVINEMGDGVIICGPDYKIENINNSASRYLNIENFNGINLIDFIFNNFTVSLSREEITDLAHAHKVFEIIRLASEKFQPLYLEAGRDILKNPSGEISSIVWLVRDVSEIKREETAKHNFLSLISHKILTPLSVILNSADLLQSGSAGLLDQKQQDFIRGIYGNARKMDALIGKILKFSALNTQHMDLPGEELNLCEYIPKFAEPVIRSFKEKTVNIKVNCEDKELKIKMNRVYFGLIISNLTENAIKFNDKEIADIVFAAEKAGGGVQISISDNGPGIPSEEKYNIFKKFYQIEKYFTGNVEGAGIGLALVKQLVEAHGGQINVEPNLGHGAKFIITLPE